MFKFIKAVSGTDMIHKGYHNKALIFIMAIRLKFIKAVYDTVFDMINTAYHDKPLMFIRATFPEKLVSHN